MTWLRRIVASIGIGATSYAIMLGIMVVSVLFDQEAAPVITFASDAGRDIVSGFDSMVSGSHWGQVAVNHLRERVNMTHVVLSIPAILIASVVVGIPFNKWLGGTRSRPAAHRHRADERPGHGRARGGAVQLQRHCSRTSTPRCCGSRIGCGRPP